MAAPQSWANFFSSHPTVSLSGDDPAFLKCRKNQKSRFFFLKNSFLCSLCEQNIQLESRIWKRISLTSSMPSLKSNTSAPGALLSTPGSSSDTSGGLSRHIDHHVWGQEVDIETSVRLRIFCLSSVTAMKSVMLTPLFTHHSLSWITTNAWASGIDPGFGSPRMYPCKLFSHCIFAHCMATLSRLMYLSVSDSRVASTPQSISSSFSSLSFITTTP